MCNHLNISFHESSIESIRQSDGGLIFDLSEVLIDNEKKVASLHLKGIRSITCDGFDVNNFRYECEDCEVSTLTYEKNNMQLIVERVGYTNRQIQTRPYEISHDSMEFQLR